KSCEEFSAIWVDGIRSISSTAKGYTRSRIPHYNVALRSFPSCHNSSDFLNK
ncbi:1132_t:CDS:1, partial [Scutellospora calospora]